jgi:hypothetical protein
MKYVYQDITGIGNVYIDKSQEMELCISRHQMECKCVHTVITGNGNVESQLIFNPIPHGGGGGIAGFPEFADFKFRLICVSQV